MLNSLSAQTPDSTIRFAGISAQYGFIIPHSADIEEIADSNPYGLQVEYSRLRYTQKSWDNCNCYSQVGVAMAYYNFGNPDELGNSWNIYLFGEPRITYGKFRLSLRAGMGFSYVTKYYDADTNPNNLFFSRPFGGILMLGLNARTTIAKSWSVGMSANYNHISNGGAQQPNKGMNFPTLSIGAEYVLNPTGLEPRDRTNKRDKSVKYYAGLFGTSRATDEAVNSDQERKMVIGMQMGAYKSVSYRSALGLALESYYDGSLKENEQVDPSVEGPWVISGLLRHHLLFGKFDFNQALGVYLYKEHETPEPLFQRYAIEYRILPSLQIGFSLKAHLQVAEQMDFRTTFIF